MAVDSVVAFCDSLRQVELLDPAQQNELELRAAAHLEAAALAHELIDRGLLTLWQVQMIFKDRGPELQLGSYLLLER